MKISKRQLRRIIKEQLQDKVSANQGVDVTISAMGPGGYDGEELDFIQGSLFNPADLLKMADFLEAAQRNPDADLIVYEVD